MFKLIRKDKKKGFTLVELIVVIAILAVLALILVPAITGYVGRANEQKNQANARALYSQAMLLATEGKEKSEIETALNNKLSAGDGGSVVVTLKDGTIDTLEYTTKDGKEYTMPVQPVQASPGTGDGN